MKLRDVAHARAGDKGDTLNISVIAFDERDYSFLARQVTVERVRDHFRDLVRGEIRRYEVPSIGALNFVMHRALAGGVTRSLRIDAHGKSLSTAMLELEIDEPPRATS
jgi:hypothetical protein